MRKRCLIIIPILIIFILNAGVYAMGAKKIISNSQKKHVSASTALIEKGNTQTASQVTKNGFIDNGKTIDSSVQGRIYFTKDSASGPYPGIQQVYFLNEEKKLVKKIDVFPGELKWKVTGRAYSSPSGKYAAVVIGYVADKVPKNERPFAQIKGKVNAIIKTIVYDWMGNTIIEIPCDAGDALVLTDKGLKAVILGNDIKFVAPTGKMTGKFAFSEIKYRMDEDDDNANELGYYTSLNDNSYLFMVRTFTKKGTIKREMILIDLNSEKLVYNKTNDDPVTEAVYFSSEKNLMLLRGRGLFAYDLKGGKLWHVDFNKILPKEWVWGYDNKDLSVDENGIKIKFYCFGTKEAVKKKQIDQSKTIKGSCIFDIKNGKLIGDFKNEENREK